MRRSERAHCGWRLGLAMAVAACGAGCAARRTAPQPQPVTVEVATAASQSVPIRAQWITTLHGYVSAQIQPHVSGYIVRQVYREGTYVPKGGVLFEIDPRPFRATLDQAMAQLAEAQANLGAARLDVKRDIPEAKARAIPQSQLDNDTQAELADKAAVAAAKAAVEQAQLNLGYTQVRTLIGGIAGIAQAQTGNLVATTTVLTSVSQVNPIKAYFPVSGAEYLKIANRVPPAVTGAPVRLHLTLADGTAYPYPGRILFANNQLDPQTGTIELVGAFPNPGRLLRPGQTGRITADIGVEQNAVLIPARAVTELQGGYEVAVVGADDKVSVRTVQVGIQEGSQWVITRGLRAGQRVVAEGTAKVHDGMTVTPRPYAPALDPAPGRGGPAGAGQ
ncbi:MAG: efflux RND transporter periplasmic adaptor subunit [Terriglobales bacterium]